MYSLLQDFFFSKYAIKIAFASTYSARQKKQGNGEACRANRVSHEENPAESGNVANTLVKAQSAGKGISQRGRVNAGRQ
jgi:hypothetical protein